MKREVLVTFNAGSSTVKIGIFAYEGQAARRIGKAVIDFRQAPLTFHLTEGPSTFDVPLEAKGEDDLDEVLSEAFVSLADHFDLGAVAAAGHRVVHGGEVFTGPARIDADAVAKIEELIPLAPLHQPQGLRLIKAMQRIRPQLAQCASFDTAFHSTISDLVRRFAIPRALHDEGIKRYGFHGLSYKFISGELARRVPDIAKRKIVVAHLGSGASLCGLQDGKSRDTSMGFSTLDGIPMATRTGALDPGVLVHLLNRRGQSPQSLEDFLYYRCGLLGVSGISGDSRELLASERPEAKEALDLFTLRIAGETARIANTLGGIDAMVFTAGIGEHQSEIRERVASHLKWLGLEIDTDANARSDELISAKQSRVSAFVIPTDEEQVIADEALSILSAP
ncbi:acetate/propionate family kinase [Neorhizobium sp. P12A]|uniref:acetate/propionate family kinase n=1 Tax=Neorhizobium sp. P12A TaxID=2268027 RepID=UPI0011EE962B|nr:acetate/propionate family kinase [Neorhizobium sp. P12A]KAA0697438.1 acetate/propionate family kinase [Neorhizobium sp. P12A]